MTRKKCNKRNDKTEIQHIIVLISVFSFVSKAKKKKMKEELTEPHKTIFQKQFQLTQLFSLEF